MYIHIKHNICSCIKRDGGTKCSDRSMEVQLPALLANDVRQPDRPTNWRKRGEASSVSYTLPIRIRVRDGRTDLGGVRWKRLVIEMLCLAYSKSCLFAFAIHTNSHGAPRAARNKVKWSKKICRHTRRHKNDNIWKQKLAFISYFLLSLSFFPSSWVLLFIIFSSFLSFILFWYFPFNFRSSLLPAFFLLIFLSKPFLNAFHVICLQFLVPSHCLTSFLLFLEV